MSRARIASVLVLVAACGAPPAPTTAGGAGAGGADARNIADAANVPPGPPRAPKTAGIDREFMRTFAMTRGFGLGRPKYAVPTPDGKAVLFLRAQARSPKQSLFETDLASGNTREVLTADALVAGPESLSTEERARRERLRISASGLAGFELSRDGTRVLVALSGRLFMQTRATGAVRELKIGKGAAFDPHFSPDGKRVAYVRANDLYAVGSDGGPEVALTKGGTETRPHGMAEFIAQEELDRARGFWWSPDGTQVLYEEADSSKVERLTIADPAHPEREPDRPFYPRPGKANADLRFGLVSANGGATTWVSWDHERYPYVATVRWTKGSPPTLVVLDRLQENMALLAVDAKSGATRPLVVEKDAAWLNVDASVPEFLEDGRSFVWSSERSGHNALDLRDAKGELVRALTPPSLEYRELVHVDTKRRLAYFLASEDPSEPSLYKVSLDGGAPERILGGPGGVASGRFGEGDDVYVAVTSTTSTLPSVTARSVDGKVTRELPSVAESPKDLRPVEIVKVGADQVRVAIMRPRTFEKGRRYPVIDAAYGGPSSLVVNASALAYAKSQWIADAADAIVVAIDAKGTPHRGRDWERALENKAGTVPVDGHAVVLKALGETFPEMDTARAGVFGWSYGGYFSAYAALARPDVYKAAVAGAPVIDWRDYDTAYTERYLGLPDANAAAYDAASVLGLLKPGAAADGRAPSSRLLVIHGTADDNVFFFNSLKLVDALERAGRTYAFMPLGGVTHQLADPDLSERVWSRVAEFFRENL